MMKKRALNLYNFKKHVSSKTNISNDIVKSANNDQNVNISHFGTLTCKLSFCSSGWNIVGLGPAAI